MDKMNVVTDKDERPVILLERADEGIDRSDIEMCRRLVHEQKIGWIKEQPTARPPRMFATAQNRDGLENIVAAKQKRNKHSARGLFGHGITHIACAVENGMARVEDVDSVLREITCAHIMSEFAHAMLHGQPACEQLEKRRFSRAIRTDKHGALTALGLILHSAINNDVAISMIDIFQRDHAQAAAHRLREMELDRLS